jgi:hypothetical protein
MARTSVSFSDLVTLTRASAKTLFGPAGKLIETAADARAINYVPTTGAVLGMRLESAGTNVAPTPSSPHSIYTLASGGAIVANQGVAPDDGATTTMARFTVDSASSTHYIARTNWNVANSGQTLTYSVFVKNRGIPALRLQLYDHTSTTNTIYATFDMTTGTKTDQVAGGAGTIISAGIEAYATGGYRLWITGCPNPGQSNNIQIRIFAMSGGSTIFLGDGVSGFDFWGVNICNSPLIQSFISSAGTRAVDIARVATLSPYFNASKGTFVFHARMPSTAPTGVKLQLFRLDDGTDDNVIEAYVPSATGNVEARIRAAGSTVFNQVAGTYTAGSVVKMNLSYAANAFAAALYGGVAVTGSSGAVPVGINAGYIGCSDVAGANSLNGDFQNFRYFPDNVSSGDLPLLTV